MPDKIQNKTRIQEGTLSLGNYDSGNEEITEAFLGSDIVPEEVSVNLLLYPTVNSMAKFNGSDKEIFCPADTWTPIGFRVTSFNLKAIEGTGSVYWQGWAL